MASQLEIAISAANAVLITEGDLSRISEFFCSDYTVHFDATQSAKGHGIIEKAIGFLKTAFPEIEIQITVLVENETRIAWMRTLRGIQTGSYQGFPASNKLIVWRDMVTSEFRDGKIAREWVVTDLAEHLLKSKKR